MRPGQETLDGVARTYASTAIGQGIPQIPTGDNWLGGEKPLDTLPAAWWNWFISFMTRNLDKAAGNFTDLAADLYYVFHLNGNSPSQHEGWNNSSNLFNAYQRMWNADIGTAVEGLEDQIEDLEASLRYQNIGTDGSWAMWTVAGGYYEWEASRNILKYDGPVVDPSSPIMWIKYQISGGGPNGVTTGGSRVGCRDIWARSSVDNNIRHYYNSAPQSTDTFVPSDELITEARADEIIAALAGGLKTPLLIAKESFLPAYSGLPDGTYYVVQEMDVSAPGLQGRAWINSAQQAGWITVVDQVQMPDNSTIEINANGQLQVSTSLQTAISTAISAASAKADTAQARADAAYALAAQNPSTADFTFVVATQADFNRLLTDATVNRKKVLIRDGNYAFQLNSGSPLISGGAWYGSGGQSLTPTNSYSSSFGPGPTIDLSLRSPLPPGSMVATPKDSLPSMHLEYSLMGISFYNITFRLSALWYAESNGYLSRGADYKLAIAFFRSCSFRSCFFSLGLMQAYDDQFFQVPATGYGQLIHVITDNCTLVDTIITNSLSRSTAYDSTNIIIPVVNGKQCSNLLIDIRRAASNSYSARNKIHTIYPSSFFQSSEIECNYYLGANDGLNLGSNTYAEVSCQGMLQLDQCCNVSLQVIDPGYSNSDLAGLLYASYFGLFNAGYVNCKDCRGLRFKALLSIPRPLQPTAPASMAETTCFYRCVRCQDIEAKVRFGCNATAIIRDIQVPKHVFMACRDLSSIGISVEYDLLSSASTSVTVPFSIFYYCLQIALISLDSVLVRPLASTVVSPCAVFFLCGSVREVLWMDPSVLVNRNSALPVAIYCGPDKGVVFAGIPYSLSVSGNTINSLPAGWSFFLSTVYVDIGAQYQAGQAGNLSAAYALASPASAYITRGDTRPEERIPLEPFT